MQTRPRPKRYRKNNRKAKVPREGKPNLTLEPYQIILRPLVTEKGTHQSTRHNAYTFEVHPLADKLQIRDAIEKLFHVNVLKVRTMNRLGKKKRYRGEMGKQSNWKKAVVTLH